MAAFEVGEELRLDLPKNWAIFWKTRPEESRLLLAHPQENEWVVTAALEADHARKLTEAIARAQNGSVIELSRMGPVGGVSNVELRICVIS